MVFALGKEHPMHYSLLVVLWDVFIRKDFNVMFIALGWAKAVDSISPTQFADALKSFGIPSQFIAFIN